MKSFSAAHLAGTATLAMAFAPASTSKASTAVNAMPGRLWNDMAEKGERSKAIPYLPRAKVLDGTLPGDYGFDPFFLSSIFKNFAGFIKPPSWEEVEGIDTLYWMREAELKHARVAMMAVSGWVAVYLGAQFPLTREPFNSTPSSYQAHDMLVSQGAMGFLLLVVAFVGFCLGASLV